MPAKISYDSSGRDHSKQLTA